MVRRCCFVKQTCHFWDFFWSFGPCIRSYKHQLCMEGQSNGYLSTLLVGVHVKHKTISVPLLLRWWSQRIRIVGWFLIQMQDPIVDIECNILSFFMDRKHLLKPYPVGYQTSSDCCLGHLVQNLYEETMNILATTYIWTAASQLTGFHRTMVVFESES